MRVPVLVLVAFLAAACEAAHNAPDTLGVASAAAGPSGTPRPALTNQPSIPAVPSVTVATPKASVPVGRTPVLGRPWDVYQHGYGAARPTTVDNGGDPTSRVDQITWMSWGGPTAVGHGLSTWVAPNTTVAENSPERATIVAFQRGLCHGRWAYLAVEWYFPQHGDKFSRSIYVNACDGGWHGL